MNTKSLGSSAMAFTVSTIVLLGCATSPPAQPTRVNVQQSKVLVEGIKPISKLRLIYRNLELKRTPGKGPELSVDQGDAFEKFGGVLVTQAPSEFAAYDLELTNANVVDGKALNVLEPPAQRNSPYVLFINPEGGSLTTTNRMNDTASFYVFSANLVDVITGRTIWQATVDITKFAPKKFISGTMLANNYDADYAKQLLGTVLAQLKKDRVVN